MRGLLCRGKPAAKNPWLRLLRLGCLFIVLLAGPPLLAAAQEQAAGLSVRIGRPAEGETFYSGPDSLLYSIPINGWAFSEDYPPQELEVQLDVIQNHTLLSSQHTHPNPDGSFLFKAEVNPGNTLASFEIAFQGCADKCHDLSAQQLPTGAFQLRVTARDPSGAQVSDQRQVTVDRSTVFEVPVQLVLDTVQEEAADRLPAGIQVSGSTQLYQWRSRGALGTSAAGGRAAVPVEVLSQAPTHYTFEVQPQVVDGVFYRGLETAAVTLLPDQIEPPEITLRVQAQTGRLTGWIDAVGAALPDPLPVLAFELPAGQPHQAQVQGPAFAFDRLPVGRYLIVPDLQALSTSGCSPASAQVDLSADPQQQVTLAVECREGQSPAGLVLDEDYQPLPFAWVATDHTVQASAVLPDNGRFQLPDQQDQGYTLVARAPGYFSQAQRVSPGDSPDLVFKLVRRPETGRLAWGTGEVLLPAESQFTLDEAELELVSGWAWGAGEGTEPLIIRSGNVTLQITTGQFALAVLPGQESWLYLFSGQAEIRRAGETPLAMHGGQMALLSGNEPLAPVAYHPAFVQAVNQAAPVPDFPVVWQPTPGAVLRDRLARLGLNTAQALTLLVYVLVPVSLLLGPLLGLYIFLRRRAGR